MSADGSGPASWVADRFGLCLRDGGGDEPLAGLVGLALRRNARRAHLLVSTVLGKHVPTDPRLVHDAGLRLGARVATAIGDRRALVIGYAETATGLGHCVAEALGADCLHSTRRPVGGVTAAAGFEEEHSHASGHLLLPESAGLLERPGVLVLVDDELSTGRTALNTIAALHRLAPRGLYVIAALVDVRDEAARAAMAETAAALGTRIDAVSLASGGVEVPENFAAAAAESVRTQGDPLRRRGPEAPLRRVDASWPVGVRESGRLGLAAGDLPRLRSAGEAVADGVAAGLTGRRVHVLATEELMYAPLLIARALADRRPDVTVTYSSTTRSPVVVVDQPGYPVRTVLSFPAHDGTEGERFAYNVAAATGGEPFDDVVVVVDEQADTQLLESGLLDRVRAVAGAVHLVVLPTDRPRALPDPLRAPGFGSYAPDEVTWLLTDLSAVELEASIEEREEAIQSGGAHYAESLPIEYQPSAQYQDLFAVALAESAATIAEAVGLVTELVLAERGPDVVLASLARAGTPIGILMRRWAKLVHGLDLAHYAVSIVRGRGIDRIALRYLAAHHDPADVVFVDGWTGKGAIARELAGALAEADPRFRPDLAVLADTGSCVTTFGTRADFLIPSACLNSTVSGLVSRTVLNDSLIGPDDFHGAKFYADLAGADVSARFLDAVSAQFDAVRASVAERFPQWQATDRAPDWSGWQAVEKISADYGINDVNLVKPGVGETTRVLLRRVPWRVLVRPGAEAELRHVLLLAEQRGVPIEPVDGLPYSCVGLIHPAYTRGATGADGRSTG